MKVLRAAMLIAFAVFVPGGSLVFAPALYRILVALRNRDARA